MKYKRYDLDTYHIHTIKTDKFRNCMMEITLRAPIKKENITKWNFLIDMLAFTSEKYPKRRDLIIEMENLYNTSVRGISTRVGNCYIISMITNFLDPKYLEKGVLKEIIKLPFELLLHPNVHNDEFDNRSFNIIKNRMKADIESLKEMASRYAFRQSLIQVDAESPVSYSMSGYLEDLEKITPSNLYATYQSLFKDFQCDIFIIGNLDMDEVVNTITKEFPNHYIKNFTIPLYNQPKVRNKALEITEEGDYTQSNLVMIYNLDDLDEYERNYVVHIFNFILGGGSLSTKLGKYLREENGLCYSTGSMYNKYDRLLIMYAGIDDSNYKKAVKFSKKALKDMIDGEFTEQELEEAKLTLISSLKMGMDSQSSIIDNYLFNYLDNLPLFEERMENLKKVTKEEVMKVAKKAKLNVVYLLRGGDEMRGRNQD